MEKIWHYLFHDEFKVPPENYSVLLTENALNPKINREYMAQTFNIPAMYVAVPAELALYSSARTFGIMIDIGDGLCNVVPIYEGCVLSHAIKQQNLAGNDITKYLQSLLQSRGYNFSTQAELEILHDIKENLCYVAFDFDKEANLASTPESSLKRIYKLPDGQTLTVDKERFYCPEILFKPHLAGIPGKGIHQAVYDCIMTCDLDVRCSLAYYIILSGASTFFPGIKARLQKELSALMHPSLPLRNIAPTDRRISAWFGGSVVASLPNFQHNWIKKEEYEECGPSIINKT